jgi:FeS assembly SUF system regulator
MIKLSRMADYAILLVSRMATNPKRLYRAQELANFTSLSITTVNKILSKLTRSKITESVRGAAGGYRLSLEAKKISVRVIIDIIDGKVALTACAENSDEYCNLLDFCPTQKNWQIINNAVCDALDSVNIEDMINPEKFFDISKNSNNKKSTVIR